MGTFKERIQWVGDPHWKDGSIVIHNLDYSDNGTFTCDVKNPPDIVGKTSQVTLYVFEKGVRGDGPGGLAVQGGLGVGGCGGKGRAGGRGKIPGLMPFRLWEGGQKTAVAERCTSETAGNGCGARNRRCVAPLTPLLVFPPLLVPTRYGVVLGAVIGGVLGVVLLLLLLFYVTRYCWLRRQAALQRRLR